MASIPVDVLDAVNELGREMLDRRDQLRRESGVQEAPPDFAVAKSSKWWKFQQDKIKQAKQ